MCKCILEPVHLLPYGPYLTEPPLWTEFNFCSYSIHGENTSSRIQFTNCRQTAGLILAGLPAGSCEQYKGNTILQVVHFNPVRTWTMARFNHLRNQWCGPFHCISSPVAESHSSILSNLLHQLNCKKHIKGHHQLVWKSLLNVYRTKEVFLWKPTKDNMKWAPNWFNI